MNFSTNETLIIDHALTYMIAKNEDLARHESDQGFRRAMLHSASDYMRVKARIADCGREYTGKLAEVEADNHGDDEYGNSCGLAIAILLKLKRNEIGRYKTAIGDKTNLGLYRTIKRILVEGK